ncbi:carboxyvinyl-carboxyphosphonate phosphorylmutase [Baekduia soli]|uniref:Carboxyvinyl-carboxyphosphonate phosphorylmutase n=1 Tax=Baekduia soli TaxID=496014 RepID=A0A5B8U2S6_9ACTN|nr:isocitrate lyase/phosphoenolpyruvate mutase family protein [Baekduia soli]QEC47337.1 carboxyvinyl-carboxyphosphonate phosphorylmutase [Baekduia soli]
MTLRERLNQPEILIAMGAHDPLTALLAQRADLEAVYHGGYAVAAHQYGLPDLGLVGLSEMVESVTRIRAVAGVPIIADADTGYGSEPGVTRAVRELERAGAGAVQIEDQVFPKRCGHMEGKRVIPAEEMAAKVRAAVAARRDPETVIIARTDALAVTGLPDAMHRCLTYADAGADVVFVDAPRDRADLAEIAQHVGDRALLMANMTETGKTELLPASELQTLGYALVIFPSTQTWLFSRAYTEVCRELLATGTTAHLLDRFDSFDDINELLGKSAWEATAQAG